MFALLKFAGLDIEKWVGKDENPQSTQEKTDQVSTNVINQSNNIPINGTLPDIINIELDDDALNDIKEKIDQTTSTQTTPPPPVKTEPRTLVKVALIAAILITMSGTMFATHRLLSIK